LQSPEQQQHPPGYEEEEEESGSGDLSVSMKSTLSNAEFLSVQSSVTTDKEAFAYNPGILKRTASLVKKPGLALGGLHRTRSGIRRVNNKEDGDRNENETLTRREEEELMKRMKHGRTVARADNRKKEAFDVDGPLAGNEAADKDVGKNAMKNAHVKVTEIWPGEVEQVQDMLVHDDTVEHTSVHNDTIDDSKGVSYMLSPDGDSMYIDNDLVENDTLLSKSTFTFDDGDTMQHRQVVVQQQEQHVRFQNEHTGGVDGGTQKSEENDNIATYPVIRTVSSGIGTIGTVASKECATQTSPDGQEAFGNTILTAASNDNDDDNGPAELGSFKHMMEAMGLFGAQICMGSSRAMLTCADSCAETPHGRKKVLLVDVMSDDGELGEERVSTPSSAARRHQQHQHHPPVQVISPSTRQAQESIFQTGWDVAPSRDIKKDEEEAAGIFTRALAMALQTTIGENERVAIDPVTASPRVSNSNSTPPRINNSNPTSPGINNNDIRTTTQRMGNNIPSQQNGMQHNGQSNMDMYIDFESVDGRFTAPQQLRRNDVFVPRNIAVKPKNKKQKQKQKQPLPPIEEPPDEEQPEPKQIDSPAKTKKGFGKIFKWLGKK